MYLCMYNTCFRLAISIQYVILIALMVNGFHFQVEKDTTKCNIISNSMHKFPILISDFIIYFHLYCIEFEYYMIFTHVITFESSMIWYRRKHDIRMVFSFSKLSSRYRLQLIKESKFSQFILLIFTTIKTIALTSTVSIVKGHALSHIPT